MAAGPVRHMAGQRAQCQSAVPAGLKRDMESRVISAVPQAASQLAQPLSSRPHPHALEPVRQLCMAQEGRCGAVGRLQR